MEQEGHETKSKPRVYNLTRPERVVGFWEAPVNGDTGQSLLIFNIVVMDKFDNKGRLSSPTLIIAHLASIGQKNELAGIKPRILHERSGFIPDVGKEAENQRQSHVQSKISLWIVNEMS